MSETRRRLLEFHALDSEERLLGAVLRFLEDPLKPRSADGQFRFNRLYLLLGLLTALGIAGFFAFSAFSFA